MIERRLVLLKYETENTIVICWVVTPCNHVSDGRRFRGTHYSMYPEDRGSMLIRQIIVHLEDCIVPQYRKHKFYWFLAMIY
jgi:hypothetical protein